MMNITGVHGRNDVDWRECDYEAVRLMRLSWLKMMSQTRPEVFARLQAENPGLQFVTRLYDGSNFGVDYHPTPTEFVVHMTPVIEQLQPYCTLFQIHNEPNHMRRIEGWGDTEEDARSFDAWFHVVYLALKSKFPDCRFGFPGLAIPHWDVMWLEVCRKSIELADWLGCHCYWQNPTELNVNHLDGNWGLRFVVYHSHFPDKDIHILEAGNSNRQAHPPYPLPEDIMALELRQWFVEIGRYDYVKSACPFLLSSPSQEWNEQFFTWVDEGGRFRQVVWAVKELREELDERDTV